MKRLLIIAAAVSLAAGCNPSSPYHVDSPLTISSPTPTEAITKVDLSDTEQGYVKAGNVMAFRFLQELYDGKNLIVSPLSLQYALAMAANGASGQTLQEIIDFLGYGKEGIDALNAYCKKMMEQLPAVDLDVALKLTDAILVNDSFPLYSDFKGTVESNYYAAVENMDFSNPENVAARINDWAYRNTNGFIDKLISADDISHDAVAFLMNALYFKARWEGGEYDPMFNPDATVEENFTRSDKSTTSVSYMQNSRYHLYAKMDGFKVLALPYAGGKFFMYILLPDGNDLAGLVKKLPGIAWNDVLSSLSRDREVVLKLPKFDIEEKYILIDNLKALGIRKAFDPNSAQFNRMFKASDFGYSFYISSVIQKARISVAEWGTEAAAVTVIAMDNCSAIDPGKPIEFFADHPFLFFIGEATSGTILFEGAYTGQ
ncbi:MAG: serpin family protein [Bacteroidales bacterium]|nr:serpin family protein [Bacteroidales bacterium]